MSMDSPAYTTADGAMLTLGDVNEHLYAISELAAGIDNLLESESLQRLADIEIRAPLTCASTCLKALREHVFALLAVGPATEEVKQ